jgi:hypothetical protein
MPLRLPEPSHVLPDDVAFARASSGVKFASQAISTSISEQEKRKKVTRGSNSPSLPADRYANAAEQYALHLSCGS